MKRTALNLLIDALAALCFLGMGATGFILRFPLPPGTNKSLALWGMSRHEWGGVHYWISLGLLAILLIHVALHWQWIVTVIARQLHRAVNSQSRHVRSGVITGAIAVVALGVFAWAAEVSVRDRDETCCPPGEASRLPAPEPLPTEEPQVVGDNGSVSFWKDVYPILETSCLSCHGPSKARASFRVDRREDYFGKSGQPPLIVSGRSEASPLVAIVTGMRKDIPLPDRHRLPRQDTLILKRWIDAGAVWPEQPTAERARK